MIMLHYNVDNIGEFTNNEQLAKLKVKRGEWKKYNTTQEAIVLHNNQYVLASQIVKTVDEIAQAKMDELKEIRDAKEVEPIETQYGIFDYDQKSRERINVALVALELEKNSKINWTLADNSDVALSANDLREVIVASAKRSNTLHTQYRQYVNQISQLVKQNNIEAIKAITWE